MKETKQAHEADPRHDMLAVFEAYRAANDQRLSAVEAKGAADPLLEEKVGRIEAALQARERAARRPALGGAVADASMADERKAAFDGYLRTGVSAGLETKGLSEGVSTSGGYVVTNELERLIERRLAQTSPMRGRRHGADHRLGRVRQARVRRRRHRQLGGRDRRPAGDHGADAGSPQLPRRRPLRQPGRHAGAPGRQPGEPRPVAGRRGETTLSLRRKRPPSWPATAPGSPRAFSAIRRWPTPRRRGGRSDTWAQASRAASRRRTRPTSSWT